MRAWLAGLSVMFGLGAAAPAARADRPPFWQRLFDLEAMALQTALAQGDQLLAQVPEAADGLQVPGQARAMRAVYKHYQFVAKRWPQASAAHLRLGGIIVHLLKICQPSCVAAGDRQLAEEALTHWQAYMTQQAGDPMVYELLFDRAILLTKLGGDRLPEATRDYRALLALSQTGVYLGSPAVLRLNLAEVLMMQGQLDAAVDEYRLAVGLARDASAVYGLAVALDRLGYLDDARAMVRALGEDAFREFRDALERGQTFYVPEGEVYYYLGVVLEALGQPQAAREAFATFVESGANARFAPQASAHMRRLAPGRSR